MRTSLSLFKTSFSRRSWKFKITKSRMANLIYFLKLKKITSREQMMLLMRRAIASVKQISQTLSIKIQMRKKKRAIRILITKANLKLIPSGLISLALIYLISQK